MPKKKYHVDLSPGERTTLEKLLRSGKAGTRKPTRARILLKAAGGLRPGRRDEKGFWTSYPRHCL